MNKDNLKKLREKTTKELREDVEKTRKELFSLRMDKSIGKLKNLRSITTKRKEIAVIKTIIKEKELK